MKATIFDIKNFAIHDGDGIRTTVFFKGCSLKCKWCHNPEGIDFTPQLSYFENKCVNCGECVKDCPFGAHRIENEKHIFKRDNCCGCGKCVENCYGNALTLYGKEVTVNELMPLLTEDRDFYETSGGGVTLSGGECLCQPDFCASLLKKLKEEGIHTAVDTCGLVNRAAFDKVMPCTDIFLYDVKAIDENVHIKCTGYSNKQILENLKYIDDCGKNIEIRIPYVPGYNSGEIEKIAEFLSGLKNIVKVKVLPYHKYAGSKYQSLDMKNTLPEDMPSDKEIKSARETIKSYNLTVAE